MPQAPRLSLATLPHDMIAEIVVNHLVDQVDSTSAAAIDALMLTSKSMAMALSCTTAWELAAARLGLHKGTGTPDDTPKENDEDSDQSEACKHADRHHGYSALAANCRISSSLSTTKLCR